MGECGGRRQADARDGRCGDGDVSLDGQKIAFIRLDVLTARSIVARESGWLGPERVG